MPTGEEWWELEVNAYYTWTTQNGVNGILITGLNGNSLFLPAAGYRDGSNLYGAGSYGIYWPSSLAYDCPYCAYTFDFHSDNYYWDEYLERYYGHSVRPVRSSRQN